MSLLIYVIEFVVLAADGREITFEKMQGLFSVVTSDGADLGINFRAPYGCSAVGGACAVVLYVHPISIAVVECGNAFFFKTVQYLLIVSVFAEYAEQKIRYGSVVRSACVYCVVQHLIKSHAPLGGASVVHTEIGLHCIDKFRLA